jgi:hypothetical protein
VNQTAPLPKLTSASKSSLPSLAELDDSELRSRARDLLRRATTLKSEIAEREEELQAARLELAAICDTSGMPRGFKHGRFGFEYHGYMSQRSLNKQKLAMKVPAEVIESCYEDGRPFMSAKILFFDLD